MGEGKQVVFVHRGAGSTEVAVWALLRRPPVEGGRQTIFHAMESELLNRSVTRSRHAIAHLRGHAGSGFGQQIPYSTGPTEVYLP